MLSILIRYGLVAVISIIGFKTINHFPPMSWIDPDVRKIKKLENDLEDCNNSKTELLQKNLVLEESILKQNARLVELQKSLEDKQDSTNQLNDKLQAELEDLKKRLNKVNPEINSCQDAIDYIIGITDEK